MAACDGSYVRMPHAEAVPTEAGGRGLHFSPCADASKSNMVNNCVEGAVGGAQSCDPYSFRTGARQAPPRETRLAKRGVVHHPRTKMGRGYGLIQRAWCGKYICTFDKAPTGSCILLNLRARNPLARNVDLRSAALCDRWQTRLLTLRRKFQSCALGVCCVRDTWFAIVIAVPLHLLGWRVD